MPLRPEYSLGHSKFNNFLFALVGKEENGLELTVLSALARLGFDPWGEAARLSAMTKETATAALAEAIAALPEGDWRTSDSLAIAGHLVDRLPKHEPPSANSPLGSGGSGQKPMSAAPKWLMWLAFLLAVIVGVSQLYGN